MWGFERYKTGLWMRSANKMGIALNCLASGMRRELLGLTGKTLT